MHSIGNYNIPNLGNLNNLNLYSNPINCSFKGNNSSPLAPLENDTFTKTSQAQDTTIKKRSDGTIDFIAEYSDNGNIAKITYYQEDGKTLETILEVDPKTENIKKNTQYDKNGKLDCILESDTKTGKISKLTEYQKDGKTIKSIKEFDSSNPDTETKWTLNKENSNGN